MCAIHGAELKSIELGGIPPAVGGVRSKGCNTLDPVYTVSSTAWNSARLVSDLVSASTVQEQALHHHKQQCPTPLINA